MTFDTPTLLIVLIVSNFLMAGAMWIAFAGRFREGLGQWTGALVVQGGAWLLIVSRDDAAGARFDRGGQRAARLLLVAADERAARVPQAPDAAMAPVRPGDHRFPGVLHLPAASRASVSPSAASFSACAQLITGAALLHYRIAAEQRTRWLLAGSFFLMSGGLLWLGFHRVVRARGDPADVGRERDARARRCSRSTRRRSPRRSRSSSCTRSARTARPTSSRRPTRSPGSTTGALSRSSPSRSSRAAAARSCRCRCSCSTSTTSSASTTPTAISPATTCSKAFALLVRNCLRKEDLLARYGGEEFVVLLPGASQAAAAALAERIREEVAAVPFDANGHRVRVTVSIGVASEAGDTLPSLEAMLGRADEALYAAKNQGRNRASCRMPMPQAAAPAKAGLQIVPDQSSARPRRPMIAPLSSRCARFRPAASGAFSVTIGAELAARDELERLDHFFLARIAAAEELDLLAQHVAGVRGERAAVAAERDEPSAFAERGERGFQGRGAAHEIDRDVDASARAAATLRLADTAAHSP